MAFVGFDAGSPLLTRKWISEGHLPNFARVLEQGATVDVEHEPGLYVGAIWPTLFTGVGVDRHGFYTGIRPAPFSYGYVAQPPTVDPFWKDVAEDGRRIAVVDVPFGPAIEGLDGVQVVEWGCHDRYYGPHSEPPDFLDDVLRDVGSHAIGSVPHPDGLERYAPCDSMHLSDGVRSPAEVRAFIDDLNEAFAARSRMTKYLLDQGPFDLVVDVPSELHCGGHHLWAVHDETHPHHDPALRRSLGSDPLLEAYRRADEILGLHLERLGDEGTLFVLLSHGMRAHFDGTHLLDEVLWRLDQSYRGRPTPWVGPATRRAARLLRHVPESARSRAWNTLAPIRARLFDQPGESPIDELPPPAERLWFQLENNTVSGAVRFNRTGREPHGVLGSAAVDHATQWLIRELRSLINVATGEPCITDVFAASDHYKRTPDDGLPDLLIEWNNAVPVDHVWSPTIGSLRRKYNGVRTGDHDGVGEMVAFGPGIARGHKGMIRTVDIAPTIAAAAGVHLRGKDGVAARGLLAGSAPTGGKTLADAVRALEGGRSRRLPPAADGSDVAALRQEIVELHQRVDGLAEAHHTTWVTANEARDTAGTLFDILSTTSWIRGLDVPDELRFTVVTPTCGRVDMLRRSVASVLSQTHTNLELIVVDDASTDGTAAWLATVDDDRLVVIRNGESLGEGGSRNVALDRASGDVIAFVDDDNWYDPDWLRSLAWLFSEHPETQVAYGARVVDDVERHHGREGRGLPWLQLNRWDRAVNAERCLVDMNTVAHRRGSARFDPDLPVFTDWDYLQALTETVDPVAFPVLAAHYTTSAPDRATDEWRHRDQDLYERVRDRWRQS